MLLRASRLWLRVHSPGPVRVVLALLVVSGGDGFGAEAFGGQFIPFGECLSACDLLAPMTFFTSFAGSIQPMWCAHLSKVATVRSRSTRGCWVTTLTLKPNEPPKLTQP